MSLAIDNGEDFDVVFEKSALTIDPNPEGGHYALNDVDMFVGSDLFYNENWGYTTGPLLPNSGFSYVPDSINALINAVQRDLTGPQYDIHGTFRNNYITLGATEPL